MIWFSIIVLVAPTNVNQKIFPAASVDIPFSDATCEARACEAKHYTGNVAMMQWSYH